MYIYIVSGSQTQLTAFVNHVFSSLVHQNVDDEKAVSLKNLMDG